MDEQTEKWTDRRMDKQTNGQTDIWTNRQMNKQTYGKWEDEQTYGHTDRQRDKDG